MRCLYATSVTKAIIDKTGSLLPTIDCVVLGASEKVKERYIAMMATKLNAQVIIKILQNMHEKSLPPTGARRRMELAYQDWARLDGGLLDRTVGWQAW